MVKRRILSVVLSVVVALSALGVPIAGAPAQLAYAAETGVSSYAALSAAITNAANGDVINLTADIDVSSGGSFYSSSGAGRTITINGNGHTIKQTGTGSKPLFGFGYGNITFTNLTFDGNRKVMSSRDGGAAIFSERAAITVTDCEFVNCYADGDYGGGAIYTAASASTLNVSRSLFVGNRSTEYDGGAIVSRSSSSSITNSSFVGNYAEYDGGAISNYSGSMSITNCTFYGNTAYEHGGAIADPNDTNAIRIKNTVAVGNAVTSTSSGRQNGADVFAYRASIDAGNNLFGKIGSASGSLVPASTSKSNVTDTGWLETTLRENGGPTRTLALMDISGSPAIDRGASGTGIPAVDQRGVARDVTPDIGAFEYVAAPPSLSVTGVTVSPKSVVLGKGDSRGLTAVVAGENGPSPEVTWSVSGGSSANTKVVSNGIVDGGMAAAGTLFVGADESATALTVTASSVSDPGKSDAATVTVVSEFDVSTGAEFNNAMRSALDPLVINITGDLSGVDAPALGTARELVINGNGHTVIQAPGGVTARMEAVSASNRLSINDLTIIGSDEPVNYKNGGGAVYLAAGDVALNRVTIKGCSVAYANDPNNQNGLRFGGGAVSVALTDPPNSTASNGSITATGCAFINNTVGHTFDNFGGGALGADEVYLTNCTFWGNKVVDSVGGAVYARIGGSMVNCTVVNNAAGVAGGGVVSRTNEVNGNYSRIHLLNCIVAGNHIQTGVDGISSATFSNTSSGVNVDQVYDQGGNIFGYVHTKIDGDYRDIVYSAEGMRVAAEGSQWSVSDDPAELLRWLDYAEPKGNGGAVPTIALRDAYGSPAIDRGLASGAVDSFLGDYALASPTADQRGEARDGKPDIGAFEYTGQRAVHTGGLQAAIDAVGGYAEADYTTSSWAKLQDALQDARAALAATDVTQEAVDAARDALQEAASALVLRAGEGDGAYLSVLVDFVGSRVGIADVYTPESYGAYAAALETAQAVLSDIADCSSAEVLAAADGLLAKFGSLAYAVDRDSLVDAARAAEGILGNPRLISLYRDALEAGLEAARAVLDDPGVTQDEVNAAFDALVELISFETEAGDKAALRLLATLASNLSAASWTPDSFALLTAALDGAGLVIDDENAVQDEVGEAEAALRDALDALVWRADFAALAAALAQADAISATSDDYVPSTIAGLLAARVAAAAVLDDQKSTQAQVDGARASLVAEVLKARKKANFKQLIATMQAAGALSMSSYTDESVQPLLESLAYGESLLTLSSEDVTQDMVDGADDDIRAKLAALILKAPAGGSGDVDDGGGSGSDGGGSGDSPGGTSGGGTAGADDGGSGGGPGATGGSAGGGDTGSGNASTGGSGGSVGEAGNSHSPGGSVGSTSNSGSGSGFGNRATGNSGASSASESASGGGSGSTGSLGSDPAEVPESNVPLAQPSAQGVGDSTGVSGDTAVPATGLGTWLPVGAGILAALLIGFALFFFRRRKTGAAGGVHTRV
jgi:hypothetical protein